jgi:chromosome partitioning protein
MAPGVKTCSVCEETFLVKFNFQIKHTDDGDPVYFCSQKCRRQQSSKDGNVECSRCGTEFEPKYAYQKASQGGEDVYYCSMDCRKPAVNEFKKEVSENEKGPMKIAVLNQKGGTGKTTTAVTVGAGLAREGHNVLIMDFDSQGHVGISLGTEGEHSLYDILVENRPLGECTVESRPNLDIIPGDDSLASTEIYLARQDEGATKLLKDRMPDDTSYDFVLLDCGPSLSLLNKNALTYAEQLIVPVACDFLSLVGVKQVLQTLKKINRELASSIDILGILPTFYDMRNNISDEAVKTLKGHFQDKVLPPIRVNTRLKEAPRENQTIFEYSPSSRGAKDYEELVEWIEQQRDDRLKASA